MVHKQRDFMARHIKVKSYKKRRKDSSATRHHLMTCLEICHAKTLSSLYTHTLSSLGSTVVLSLYVLSSFFNVAHNKSPPSKTADHQIICVWNYSTKSEFGQLVTEPYISLMATTRTKSKMTALCPRHPQNFHLRSLEWTLSCWCRSYFGYNGRVWKVKVKSTLST